jgi:hypothetical protein
VFTLFIVLAKDDSSFILKNLAYLLQATIHAIASHLGASVCEWNTPTPIIWQEHLHNSSTGI